PTWPAVPTARPPRAACPHPAAAAPPFGGAGAPALGQRYHVRNGHCPRALMLDRLPTLLERLFLGPNIARRAALAKRVPHSLIERVQMAEFRKTVERVGARSAFYKERFAAAGIQPGRVRRPGDLGEFYTTSADLRARDTAEFLCAPPQAGFETTGTTAQNKRIYFSNEEVHDIGFEGAV